MSVQVSTGFMGSMMNVSLDYVITLLMHIHGVPTYMENLENLEMKK